MSFSKSALTLSITTILASTTSTLLWADEEIPSSQSINKLESITITAHPLDQTDADFGVADQNISREKLQESGTTLGEALKNELGIHSNSFGSGSSRPVIRGQEGSRVKVTQNATETMDVSSLSPDHAVTIDPQLA